MTDIIRDNERDVFDSTLLFQLLSLSSLFLYSYLFLVP